MGRYFMSTAERVRREFKDLLPGGVIASVELHRLSEDSKQVDKAVSRIFKEEGIQKIRNGLYFKPYISSYFGQLPPKTNDILKSVRKQYKAKLLPSGKLAAYELGFIQEAPEEKTYDTDKRIATIQTDNNILHFRQVKDKKLMSPNTQLTTLLLALEYVFKEFPELNELQKKSIHRKLGKYSIKTIEKSLPPWPKWFRDKIMPFVKPEELKHYITGTSALNIPYQGEVSDWHQMGMLNSHKFQTTENNYHSAPNLSDDELFDCSDFLNKHQIKLNTHMCGKPTRAVKDILYSNILIKNKYPYFFTTDQYMISLSDKELIDCVDQLRPFATKEQSNLLDKWLSKNGIH